MCWHNKNSLELHEAPLEFDVVQPSSYQHVLEHDPILEMLSECYVRMSSVDEQKLLIAVYQTNLFLTPTCDRSSSPRNRSFSISKRCNFWLVVSQLPMRPISADALSYSALDLPSSLCEHSNLLSSRSFSAKARCKRVVNLSTSLSNEWSFILYSAISRSCNSRSSIFSLSARSRCSLCCVKMCRRGFA